MRKCTKHNDHAYCKRQSFVRQQRRQSPQEALRQERKSSEWDTTAVPLVLSYTVTWVRSTIQYIFCKLMQYRNVSVNGAWYTSGLAPQGIEISASAVSPWSTSTYHSFRLLSLHSTFATMSLISWQRSSNPRLAVRRPEPKTPSLPNPMKPFWKEQADGCVVC